MIIGADGLIGQALVAHLIRAGESVWETTRRPETVSGRRLFLDLAEDVSSWHPPDRISVAYLCAAVSSLERCRKEPVQSAVVNVQNTVVLAKTLVERGVFVVFPSTNLVYDGSAPFRKADDPVCPRTEYGRQKAAAEKQLSTLGDSVAIVRFTKVIGPDMPLFKGWIQALRNGETIHPFSDMVLAPVPLPFAVEVLHRVGKMRLPGILQVSGEKDITYEQMARYIARRLGVNSDRVQPLSWQEAGLQPEAAPTHTTLDTTRLRVECGMKPPDVWLAVEEAFFSAKPQNLPLNIGAAVTSCAGPNHG